MVLYTKLFEWWRKISTSLRLHVREHQVMNAIPAIHSSLMPAYCEYLNACAGSLLSKRARLETLNLLLYMKNKMNLYQNHDRYNTDHFEDSETDRAWLHRRSIQVDMMWEPSTSIQGKQARK